MRFNTIGVSDGISMGTEGMSYSLQSRDLIADSIETVMGAQWYDALIALPGCDKNMPGCLMAMGRLNRPAIMVYGGTIRAGCTEVRQARHRLGVSVVRQYLSGRKITTKSAGNRAQQLPRRRGLRRHVHRQHHGLGDRDAGNELPYSSSIPAEDPAKLQECVESGEAIRKLSRTTSSRATS
jgi:dihydroxy-acid dehydratase